MTSCEFKVKKLRLTISVSVILIGLVFFPLPTVAQRVDIETALERLEQQPADELEIQKQIDQPPAETLERLEMQFFEQTEKTTQSEGAGAAGLSPAASEILDDKSGEMIQSKELHGGIPRIFNREELLLDLPALSVLAAQNGEPLVYADEFNLKVQPAFGEDLFDARYLALRAIIETKFLGQVAKQEGLDTDPYVVKNKSEAEAKVQAAETDHQYAVQISDSRARRYYNDHIEEFKRQEGGARVLFAVSGSYNEGLAIVERLKNGEPFSRFSFSPDPIPGSWLPTAVQKATFHLEPGGSSGVVATPIGFYVVKLIDRDPFDRFKVSFIVTGGLTQCWGVLKRIESGEKFETLIAEKEHLSVDVTGLPEAVQKVVPGMALEEISHPVATSLGFFLIQLKERWSSADIITARLIRVNSRTEGEKIQALLNQRQPVEGVDERQISGKDLPEEIRVAARGLEEGKYSPPVKTKLGYYLIKVEERTRGNYRPFDQVKEGVLERMRAEAISEDSARRYYEANRGNYRRPEPEYFVDIIFSEDLNQAEKIRGELTAAPEGEARNALFTEHRKDLREIPVTTMPEACRNVARKLSVGQLSPVVGTYLGFFILRLNRIEDPSYFAFEDVLPEIKSLLGAQEAELADQRLKRKVQVIRASAEEKALATVYSRSILQKIDTVSEAEAEEWWENNKEEFLAAIGYKGKEEFAIPLELKKQNFIWQRKNDLVHAYLTNDVTIYENLLY